MEGMTMANEHVSEPDAREPRHAARLESGPVLRTEPGRARPERARGNEESCGAGAKETPPVPVTVPDHQDPSARFRQRHHRRRRRRHQWCPISALQQSRPQPPLQDYWPTLRHARFRLHQKHDRRPLSGARLGWVHPLRVTFVRATWPSETNLVSRYQMPRCSGHQAGRDEEGKLRETERGSDGGGRAGWTTGAAVETARTVAGAVRPAR